MVKLEFEPRSSALGHMWAWNHCTISLLLLSSVYSSEHFNWVSSNGIPRHFIMKPKVALSKDRFFPPLFEVINVSAQSNLKDILEQYFQIVFHRTLSALWGASEASAIPRDEREQATSRIPTLILLCAFICFVLCTSM